MCIIGIMLTLDIKTNQCFNSLKEYITNWLQKEQNINLEIFYVFNP